MARERERQAAQTAQDAVDLRMRVATWLTAAGMDDPALVESVANNLAKCVLAMNLATHEIEAMLDVVPDERGAARAVRHATSIELWLFEELLPVLQRLCAVWGPQLTPLLADHIPAPALGNPFEPSLYPPL